MKWISVKDRLPLRHEMGHAMIYRPDSPETQGSKIQIIPIGMVRIMIDSTHWMPLPEPPK